MGLRGHFCNNTLERRPSRRHAVSRRILGDADDAAADFIVAEATDAAHHLVAAKPVVDAIDEMEADAVKARVFEGLGDQAAIVLVETRR